MSTAVIVVHVKIILARRWGGGGNSGSKEGGQINGIFRSLSVLHRLALLS